MGNTILSGLSAAIRGAARTAVSQTCLAGLVLSLALMAGPSRPDRRGGGSRSGGVPLPLGDPVEEDPAAEFEPLRGSLQRLRVPEGGRVPRPEKRAKSFQQVELVTIEGASDFKSDRVLSDRELLIEELHKHEQMQQLVEAVREVFPESRKRADGDWLSLYLYMVDGAAKNPYDLAQTEALRHGARVSGFGDWLPKKSLIEKRFAELECCWEILANAVGEQIGIAADAVPELVDVVYVDSTAARSAARLEHCCTDLEACRKAGRREAELSPAEWRKALKKARQAEAELPEDQVPPKSATRQQVVLVDDETKRGPQLYRLFFINGHWYRSLDVTSGFRRYDSGLMWHGSFHQFAVSPVVWLPVSALCFPCDMAEFDGCPALLDYIVASTGRRPYIVGTDRGFSISPFYEYNLRRGTSVVAPRRGINDKNPRINLRRPWFDEHGLPRCAFCGGVGLVDLPGLGLERRGRDPRIAFACAAPFFPECTQRQLFDPMTLKEPDLQALKWVSALPLSRLTELYQAIRYWRSPSEGVHRQIRWNYLVAGNDVGSKTFRPGIPAQRLRMWAGLLLSWWRLNLRHGWIESRGLKVTINDSRLVRLNGIQDRQTGRITTPGHGSRRVAAVLAERAENNTDLPYGDALAQLRARVKRELGLKEDA